MVLPAPDGDETTNSKFAEGVSKRLCSLKEACGSLSKTPPNQNPQPMSDVLIYRPAASAMQSGSKTAPWTLVFCSRDPIQVDPMMRCPAQDDTRPQSRLTFATREAAVAYAKANKLSYTVQEPQERATELKPHSYTEHLLKPHMRS